MTDKNQEPGPRVSVRPLAPEDFRQALEACRRRSEKRLQTLLRALADLDNQAKRATQTSKIIRAPRASVLIAVTDQ